MSRQPSVSSPLFGRRTTGEEQCRRGIAARAKARAAAASSQAPACTSENFPKGLLTAFNGIGLNPPIAHHDWQAGRPYKKRRRASPLGCLDCIVCVRSEERRVGKE